MLVNGERKYLSNEDTQWHPGEGDFEPANENNNGFIYFSTEQLPTGNNSIEISVLSYFDVPEPNFKSKAFVEIKRITFLDTTTGGAGTCVAVPDGAYAPANSHYPNQCEAG